MRLFKYLTGAMVASLTLFPQTALALQPHGPPEGLYVHQMGHVLFAGAMIFFLLQMKGKVMPGLPGFRLIRLVCVLLALWNLDAFVGHSAEVYLSPECFVGPAGDFSRRLLMTGLPAWVYYLTKMDHLILVPAFYLLYRGLKGSAPPRDNSKA